MFLDLQDVASDLPPLSEEVHEIEMDEDEFCMNYLQAYRAGKLDV